MNELVVVCISDSPLPANYDEIKRRAKYFKEKEINKRKLEISCRLVETPRQDLKNTITKLNEDSGVAGISILLPLPPDLNLISVASWISERKDVEGLRSDSSRNVFAVAINHFFSKVGFSKTPRPILVVRRTNDIFSLAFLKSLKTKGYKTEITDNNSSEQVRDSLDSSYSGVGWSSSEADLFLNARLENMISHITEKLEKVAQTERVGLFTDQEDVESLQPRCDYLIDLRDLTPGKTYWEDRNVFDGLLVYALAVKLTVGRTAEAARG